MSDRDGAHDQTTRIFCSEKKVTEIFSRKGKSQPKSQEKLSVDVVGGGPVGLVFAAALKDVRPDSHVRVFEPRWQRRLGRTFWKGIQDGNARREQVVTLQSSVYTLLPPGLKDFVFGDCLYQELWPLGPDSPAEVGRPRNVRIRDFEDAALRYVQDFYDVELVPGRYSLDAEARSDARVLAVCDGARSSTLRSLGGYFGAENLDIFAVEGGQAEGSAFTETVLGLQVRSSIKPAAGVLLTVANNRFLLNALFGEGFLNMRLAPEEAREVLGIGSDGLHECIQSRPCFMRREAGQFRCPTHGSVFKPQVDPYSFLWPRILDGLRLFDVKEDDLHGIAAFRLATPIHRPRFSAEIAPGRYAFLLGDAANAIHFWPGRGLNSGLKSAVSLARCIASRWKGRRFRDADFTRHEGVMHMLQFREKGRAWRVMHMAESGRPPRTIHERIRNGLAGPFDPAGDSDVLIDRMLGMRARIRDRMLGDMPSEAELRERLDRVSPATLRVLVETGPWITDEVGGEEVDIEALFPAMRGRSNVARLSRAR